MGNDIAVTDTVLWRCLRPGLSAHTAQALGAGPVSAALPNAGVLNLGLRQVSNAGKGLCGEAFFCLDLCFFLSRERSSLRGNERRMIIVVYLA
jgi:hypothetical protein